MMPASEPRLDAATGLSLGARERQEDAVLCDVPVGGGAGFLVLADGLGGHVSGTVASRLAVATALDELTGQRNAFGANFAALGRPVEKNRHNEYDDEHQYGGANDPFLQSSIHHSQRREYSRSSAGPTR